MQLRILCSKFAIILGYQGMFNFDISVISRFLWIYIYIFFNKVPTPMRVLTGDEQIKEKL